MPEPTAAPTAHHPHPSRRAIMTGAIIAVVLLLAFILIGYVPRRARDKDLAARAQAAVLADSIRIVNVTRVDRADAASELSLPGTLQSSRTSPVYARSSGYVRRWYADIGQHVHTGQMLADIYAPDLDQQLAQSRQFLNNQRATLALNAVTLARWKVLYQDSAVTHQELDQFQATYDASVASVAAAVADVQRLESLVGYERVTAPFTGVITSRNVENGTFVTGTGTSSAPQPAGQGGNTLSGTQITGQLFTVSAIDTIRVYVGVPQSYAPSVQPGGPALLEVAELRGRTFAGRVARTANAVDFSSRTLLTEVDIANPSGALLPGMYGQVHFRFDRTSPPLLIPGTAMIYRLHGAQAAAVGPDSALHFRNLLIGRDYGTVIEVDSGLTDNDYVVSQPSDGLRNGQRVHARLEPEAGAPGDNPAGTAVPPPAPSAAGRAPAPASAPATPAPATPAPAAIPAPARSATKIPAGSTYKPPPEVNEGFPGAPVPAPPSANAPPH
ncbi:MAG TPA: efflux RND transporter periplasmic adaptor subunit [Gemmatimonadaceae bacterium]|jgi:membrane fusion protein (multidrug efflux system)|nr:efflux RND transporter periplasmic adaptor subunit [Gemmatimonadaceae bacterium]